MNMKNESWEHALIVLDRAITQRDIAMNALVEICSVGRTHRGIEALEEIVKVAEKAAVKLLAVNLQGDTECSKNQSVH